MVVPPFRIQNDVSSGGVKVLVVTNDALVIIPLPNVSISFRFNDLLGGVGFEDANDGPERISHCTSETSGHSMPSTWIGIRRICADYDDPVHVIRHDDESVESDVWEMERNLAPTFTNDPSSI
jgi:hypothetical protein